MPPTIRPSRDSDIPAITAIYRDAVLTGTASFELQPPDEGEMAQRRTGILAAGYPYLVSEVDGVVAGYAYAGAYRPRPAYRHTVENSIYVAADRRKAGVGKALLGALIFECARLGFEQMIAVIGDSVENPSIRLHGAMGFRLIGIARDVGFKFGRRLDQVLMQKDLRDVR
jgi:phosphinothricin acetyltransferase